MQLSARGAQKTRDESKKLTMYSKQWAPGDRMRVFLPIFWEDGHPEVAVGAVWGHKVGDMDELGLKTTFIPSTTEFDENAIPIGVPDVTYQFSQIARVFINGAQRLEEAEVMKKQWPSDSSRKEALKKIEHKYDAKNNQKAVKPLIGRAEYYISTECISFKCIDNDEQRDATIAITSFPMSNKQIKQIYAVMDDQRYAPEEGATFFEIEYNYPLDPDKGQSGSNVTVNGLTPEMRSSVMYPNTYKAVMSTGSGVARDSDTIKRRAVRFVQTDKIRQALTQYVFMKSEWIDAADEEDRDTLSKHPEIIQELEMLRAITNTDLHSTLESKVAELNAIQTTAPSIPAPAEDAGQGLVEGAPSIEQLLSQQAPAPTPEPAPAPAPAPAPEVQTPQATVPPVTPTPTVATPVTPVTPVQPIQPAQPIQQTASVLMNNVNNAGAMDNTADSIDFSAAQIV